MYFDSIEIQLTLEEKNRLRMFIKASEKGIAVPADLNTPNHFPFSDSEFTMKEYLCQDKWKCNPHFYMNERAYLSPIKFPAGRTGCYPTTKELFKILNVEHRKQCLKEFL